MSHAVAYALTDEHDLASYGGTVHLRDGLHLTIHDALREGDGVIVTDDELLIRTLNDRFDLRRLDRVPEGAKITSHQLAETTGEQHQRDKSDVPEIALETFQLSGLDRMAAQARGDLPIATVQPGDEHEEMAARAMNVLPTAPPSPPPAGPTPVITTPAPADENADRDEPTAPPAGALAKPEAPPGDQPAAVQPRPTAPQPAQPNPPAAQPKPAQQQKTGGQN